ncbi:hypothetical protein F442_12890 [Phytophthora nicotianae P10297]|uniref:Uncharacterized protein n=1 Tax=Phytophthora nicotianae P10297 TaxID=1317064 RepID=W2YXB3_PHYNI|nr:hypothetical protein F442_12890 [Phytophthora nicotianae P10297]
MNTTIRHHYSRISTVEVVDSTLATRFMILGWNADKTQIRGTTTCIVRVGDQRRVVCTCSSRDSDGRACIHLSLLNCSHCKCESSRPEKLHLPTGEVDDVDVVEVGSTGKKRE